MGRNKKVTVQEVIDSIKDSGQITIAELANVYDVCKQTIRSRVREAREDEEFVMFNKDGLFMIDTINTNKKQRAFTDYSLWLFKTLKGVSLCGKFTKQLMIESKEYLKSKLSKEERKILNANVSRVLRVLDYLQIEDDME